MRQQTEGELLSAGKSVVATGETFREGIELEDEDFSPSFQILTAIILVPGR